jgi:hypothetical protein
LSLQVSFLTLLMYVNEWIFDSIHLVQVRWYNDFRELISPNRPQRIASHHPDSVGFIIISERHFFRAVVDNFDSSFDGSHFVDSTVDKMLDRLVSGLDPSLGAQGWNTDKPPYVHVQTIGHVAGVDEYVTPDRTGSFNDDSLNSHRDREMWGELASEVLGVSIHPEYGGWYAYRMLLVLHRVQWPHDVPRKKLVTFLSKAERELIISEYNRFPDLGRWRDFNDKRFGIKRYETAQYLFFHEKSSEKRRRILELMKIEQNRLDR